MWKIVISKHTVYMISYVENLIEPIREFTEVAGHKSNIKS
jgi:hypothetical protein